MLRGKKLEALIASAAVVILVSAAGSVSAAVHKISKGDTVYDLAKKHHVSVDSILHANGLTDKSVLSLGRTLKIPTTVSKHKKTAAVGREDTIKLKRHQYSERIAKKPTVKKSTDDRPWYEEDCKTQEQELDNTRWNDLIRTAKAHMGDRYRYGGTSRGGFDCSGFVRYVYAKYGVRLPHSSRSQFGHGQSVSKSELQPGDLVFFHTNRSGISHVGIYIGSSKFIHASNVRRGVTVDSLNSSYYSNRYVGARRID